MKTSRSIVALLLLGALQNALAQSTAFTYQGRLADGGTPANGTYDLRFAVFDAGTVGSQLGGTLTNAATLVNNGLFVVTLDFGTGVFAGADRWLEMGARTNGGGAFITLSPRQKITPTPQAIYSANAGTAATAASATTATTANNFSGSLSGDVTGTQAATVVANVGGQSAASVATGAGAANAASSAGTPNTIVKRDGAGNFNAGTITANLAGNAATATSATSATTANSFSGPLSGDVTGTQGATVVANVGGQTAANVASGANAANAAASANTPGVIVRRDAAGTFSAGGISGTNFTGNGAGLTNLNPAGLIAGTAGISISGNAATATTAASASSLTGSLAGDVTGTQGATLVANVGGQSAVNVASGATAANTAASANTASAIVRRDASGNFSAGTVTGNLSGNATTATMANNFSGSLAGDVTGTQGATAVATVGGQSAADVASGASAANAATSANTQNAIVKRDGSGNFSAGAVSATSVSGNGSGLTSLNGANLVNSSVAAEKLGSGAALTNLNASGQNGVPSGGMILSSRFTDTNLANAGYVRFGTVLSSEAWQSRANATPLAARYYHTAVWTGSEMIIWGGYNLNFGGSLVDGGRYNPATDSWTAISSNGAPAGGASVAAVWTGSEMIIWGGYNDPGTVYHGTGARYNPVTDSWIAVATNGAPSAREFHATSTSFVWTGAEMILWGGNSNTTFFSDGARYNPTANTWTAMTNVGAPSPRRVHTAVWSGTEMIVWGGASNTTFYGDGARYNPTANTWAPVTNVGAPSARGAHTAIWTGTEMIVWGGDISFGNTYLNDGARYNPASNTWTTVTTTGAPSARGDGHRAVWTGSEMIVWGGFAFGLGARNDGGRYNPTADSWTATAATGASGRYVHTAVWTGGEMIVFGGYNGSSYLNDTYSYVPPRTLYLYTRP